MESKLSLNFPLLGTVTEVAFCVQTGVRTRFGMSTLAYSTKDKTLGHFVVRLLLQWKLSSCRPLPALVGSVVT